MTILVTVPFAMFYLAPRIPFLVEDYKKRSTWIQIFLVVAPLAYRLIMPDI
ncbi:MAG: hypothetical protein GYA55_08770 [SAR324 cluster bacterium]|uniref:Uncharacterized protein n=1 Tax=SAR324 cluster bacterium TaxID=2024889 RepID=A0A7X9FSY6_9DELT|nr:hypothetical protein [SAR324 cluster bacterium]